MRFLPPTLLLFSLAVAVPQQHHYGLRRQKELEGDDNCAATFQELDADHNGYLTKSDLATVLSGMSMNSKEIDNYLLEVDDDSSMTVAAFCNNKRENANDNMEQQKPPTAFVVATAKRTKEILRNKMQQKYGIKTKKAEVFKTHVVTQTYDASCHALFNGMDSNGDDQLDRNDVEIAFAGYATDQAQLDALVDEFFSSMNDHTMDINDFGAEYCEPVEAVTHRNSQPDGKVPYEDCIPVFKELDSNGDSALSSGEMQPLVDDYGIPANEIDSTVAEYGGELQYIEFREEFCSEPPPPTPAPTEETAAVRYRNDPNVPDGKIPYDECRDVFQELDWYGDGEIDCWDIESLEDDYGIPSDDIEWALREYAVSSEDGQVQMDYDEFRHEFCG